MQDLFNNDTLQFARLIAEIEANGCLSKEGLRTLGRSMDLKPARLSQVFERAQRLLEDNLKTIAKAHTAAAGAPKVPTCPKCKRTGKFETDWWVVMSTQVLAQGMDVHDYGQDSWDDSSPEMGGKTVCPRCRHEGPTESFGIETRLRPVS